MKGIYCLVIRLPGAKEIPVGRLGKMTFEAGYYIYVGSAMLSLEARLKRHRSKRKKIHWHIDYLLREAELSHICSLETEERLECAMAERLAGRYYCIPAFGSSDCSCRGHLFYSEEDPKEEVEGLMEAVGAGR